MAWEMVEMAWEIEMASQVEMAWEMRRDTVEMQLEMQPQLEMARAQLEMG